MSGPTAWLTRVRAWCLYDWANSAFATTVMAAVLPPYFARVAASGLSPADAAALWGYASSGFLLVAAIVSPLVGAVAGSRGSARGPFAIAVGIGAVATAFLFGAGAGDWQWVLVAYGIAFVCFSAATVLYDGLLPAVAAPAERDAVSTRGFAWGYAGGGLLLAQRFGCDGLRAKTLGSNEFSFLARRPESALGSIHFAVSFPPVSAIELFAIDKFVE